MRLKRGCKVGVGIAVALVLAVAGIRVVHRARRRIAGEKPPMALPMVVFTARVRKGTLMEEHRYLGTLEARHEVRITPRVMGQIVSMGVREGDRVKAGEPLARLDNRAQQATLRSLKAQFRAAKAELVAVGNTHHRDVLLYQAKALSREALERSKAALREAEARVADVESQLRKARLELSYTRLVAPCDAMVIERLQQPGDLALPGNPILALVDTRQGYKLSVHVPQEVFSCLRLGAEVKVFRTLGRSDPFLRAHISRLYPPGRVNGGGLPVCEIDFSRRPFGLPVGSSLHVVLAVGKASGFVVPSRALLPKGRRRAVIFSLDSTDHVHPVMVKVLVTNPDEACVDGKLRFGAPVVVGGEDVLLRLRDGRKVQPIQDAQAGEA